VGKALKKNLQEGCTQGQTVAQLGQAGAIQPDARGFTHGRRPV
jgi:hypothetical protein